MITLYVLLQTFFKWGWGYWWTNWTLLFHFIFYDFQPWGSATVIAACLPFSINPKFLQQSFYPGRKREEGCGARWEYVPLIQVTFAQKWVIRKPQGRNWNTISPLLVWHSCVCQLLSCVQLFETQWPVAHQALLSMGFSRQEYWGGLSCPSPGASDVVVVVQLLTCIWLFVTLWTAACQASLLHHLPEFAQTHVHWVGNAIRSSHSLLSPSPPAFNRSQHQGLY